MADSEVLHAYGALASDIVAVLGTDIGHADPDRTIIDSWAASVAGSILDVGSGTGRWSGHLARLGFDVQGLEPVPELLNIARVAHPSVPFRQQAIADLADGDEQWSGILAWYSLIHMTPYELAAALEVLNQALAPGGTLLMSYFSGETLEVFQHPVALAYQWPTHAMAGVGTAAGFKIVTQYADPRRPHAITLAQKPVT